MGESQYYKTPGYIYLNGGQLDAVLQQAAQVAEQLSSGDPSSLPDSVLNMLADHTEAFNTQFMAHARQELAGEIGQPPYTSEQAQQLGALVFSFIGVSQQAAVGLQEVDQQVADTFSNLPEIKW